MAGEIDKKLKLIASAEDDLLIALEGIDKQLAKEIIKIYARFVSGDTLTLDVQKLAQLEEALIAAVAKTNYKLAIDAYIPNFDAVNALNTDIQKIVNGINATDVIKESDKINNFTNAVEAQLRATNSVNIQVTTAGVKEIVPFPNNSLDELIQPIAEVIRKDVIQGVTFEAATEGILDAIQRKELGLEQWAGQIARDALSQADGITNDEIRKEFDLKYVRYIGTVKLTTRPICYHLVTKKPVMKYEDLQKEINPFVPGGIPSETSTTETANGKSQKKGAGIIPGTDAGNFITRRGGYNCRHSMIAAKVPPSDMLIEELAPETIAENEKTLEENL